MSKKLLGFGVVLALVATVLVGVGAQTASADASQCAMVTTLATAGLIPADKVADAKIAAGCSAMVSTSYVFTKEMGYGSTGADVTALQTKLGVTPVTGFFGNITKKAVADYQVANGIVNPGTGYVGPLTLAKLNASATVAPAPGTCPAGMTCTPVAAACPAGFTCTPTSGSVTTTGQEGSITVTSSSVGLPSTIYEGDSKAGILGLKIEAKNSDVVVQRINIDLGTTSRIYNKVLNKIYVMDGSTVLSSSDLNSDTVIKDSNNEYYITLTGINLVIAKDATKTLKIAVDVKDTVDSSYRNTNFPIALYGTTGAGGAVRAVDGAGIDQYAGVGSASPLTGTYKNLSVSSVLADTATLVISTDSSTPDANSFTASEGSNNDELDGVTLLKFALQGKKDDLTVTDLQVAAAASTGAATLQTVYLFDGSTEIDSGSLSSGVVTFSDVNLLIAKDTTKVLTVKADVRGATTAVTTWSATTTASYVTVENTTGTTITPTGSATGNAMSFVKAGPEYTLVSKSVGTKSIVNNTNGTATSTQDFNFKIRVTAVGGSVIVGNSATTTPTFSASTTAAYGVNVYQGSTALTLPTSGVSIATASYFRPSSGTTLVGNDYLIAEGQSADFDVTYSVTVPSAMTGSYSVGIKGLVIGGTTVSFMNGLSSWRTAGVQLP